MAERERAREGGARLHQAAAGCTHLLFPLLNNKPGFFFWLGVGAGPGRETGTGRVSGARGEPPPSALDSTSARDKSRNPPRQLAAAWLDCFPSPLGCVGTAGACGGFGAAGRAMGTAGVWTEAAFLWSTMLLLLGSVWDGHAQSTQGSRPVYVWKTGRLRGARSLCCGCVCGGGGGPPVHVSPV